MRRVYIPFILFFLVVFEGVALDLLPTMFISSKTLIVSHWVFVFLILVAIFYDDSHTYFSVFYAIIFGLFIDIVYTDLLGIYMFTYTIIVYIVHQLTKLFHANFYITILLTILGLAMVDISIYLLYSVIGKVNILWEEYMLYRLLPTVLANIIFSIFAYFVFKNRLITWSQRNRKGSIVN